MSNFTKEGIYENVQAVSCTSSLYGNYFIHSLTVLNVLLAITASLENTLILAALRKETSIFPPSKLMFQCLAVTDLCVGVLAQPLFVIQLISTAKEQQKLCYAVVSMNDIAGSSFSGVSLCTLTAISLDRLLALRLGLRYRRTITLRRTRGILIFFWIFNIAMFSLRRFWKHVLISRIISVVIYSSLTISALSYLKIYLLLRRHRNVMQDIVQQGRPNRRRMNTLNIARYRKTVSTSLCVQLALVACYLPYAIVVAIAHASGYAPSFNLSVRLTITFVLLNSSFNPILYCWKIKGVRQAVKQTVRQLCNSCNCS